MQRWIALFRGINVGGANSLPMAKLKAYLESVQLANVKTYIQSGNAVFDSTSKSAKLIQSAILRRIEDEHSFCPQLLLLKPDELQAAVDRNPFPEAISTPQSLYVYFLEQLPKHPDLKALDLAKSPTERYELIGQFFYLHAPDGVGRSRLAACAERHLGVITTARNFRTVEKLIALANG